MKFIPTAIADVILVEPKVFDDARGFFMESWNKRAFFQAGIPGHFVQDNHSRSAKGVLRGLHYQIKQAQAKLVRVIVGEIFDVAVDIRKSSPTFGKVVTVTLSAENKQTLWVPTGFAHGFYVTSEHAEVIYKTTDFYAPEHERVLLWNDPALAIRWPLHGDPLLATRDAAGKVLGDIELFP